MSWFKSPWIEIKALELRMSVFVDAKRFSKACLLM